jgi:ABC-type polysaccharide/polyol phosphate export permease
MVYLNPIFGWVTGIKSATLGTPIDWLAVACSSAWMVFLLWLGMSYFIKAERRFADII